MAKCLLEISKIEKGIRNCDQGKTLVSFCEAQARVRQGSARDGSQGKRPQSLNPSLELTLKLAR